MMLLKLPSLKDISAFQLLLFCVSSVLPSFLEAVVYVHHDSLAKDDWSVEPFNCGECVFAVKILNKAESGGWIVLVENTHDDLLYRAALRENGVNVSLSRDIRFLIRNPANVDRRRRGLHRGHLFLRVFRPLVDVFRGRVFAKKDEGSHFVTFWQMVELKKKETEFICFYREIWNQGIMMLKKILFMSFMNVS